MLKIWSEFIFSHSYFHYSLKLLPTTQHTFILLHCTSFWGKRQKRQNLVRIHLQPLVPPLYFETITNHSAYFHSTAFRFLLRQIGQCWKFGQNTSSAACASIIFWNYYQPLSILSFHCISFPLEANRTMLKNLVRFHLQPLIPPLFFETITNHSAYLHSTAFCFLFRQCWKFGQNSSLATCTSIIV